MMLDLLAFPSHSSLLYPFLIPFYLQDLYNCSEGIIVFFMHPHLKHLRNFSLGFTILLKFWYLHQAIPFSISIESLFDLLGEVVHLLSNIEVLYPLWQERSNNDGVDDDNGLKVFMITNSHVAVSLDYTAFIPCVFNVIEKC